jgi:hypothetical protein
MNLRNRPPLDERIKRWRDEIRMAESNPTITGVRLDFPGVLEIQAMNAEYALDIEEAGIVLKALNEYAKTQAEAAIKKPFSHFQAFELAHATRAIIVRDHILSFFKDATQHHVSAQARANDLTEKQIVAAADIAIYGMQTDRFYTCKWLDSKTCVVNQDTGADTTFASWIGELVIDDNDQDVEKGRLKANYYNHEANEAAIEFWQRKNFIYNREVLLTPIEPAIVDGVVGAVWMPLGCHLNPAKEKPES